MRLASSVVASRFSRTSSSFFAPVAFRRFSVHEPKDEQISSQAQAGADRAGSAAQSAERATVEKQSPFARFRRPVGVAVTGTLALLGKTKWVLVTLKLAKFSTLISLTLSIGAYSFVFGAPFAVGLVGQLLAHEGGHALMMRRLNIAFGPMLFVPFLGAMVANLSEVKSAYDESKIALAGPAAGTAIALALSAIGIASESQLLLSLASAGYLLNMFNLLPIGSLDGGRVASALSKYFLLAGLVGGAFLAYSGAISSPVFYLILFLGGFNTASRFFGSNAQSLNPNYYALSGGKRATVIFAYVAILGLLLAGNAVNERYLVSAAELRRRQGTSRTKLEEASDVNVIEEKMSQIAAKLEALNPFSQPQTHTVVSIPKEQFWLSQRVLRVCPEAKEMSEIETLQVKQIQALKNRDDYLFMKVPLSCTEEIAKLKEKKY